MRRFLFLAYGAAAYVLFLIAFLYAIGFVADLPIVPKGINDGELGPVVPAILTNVVLLGLFAVQHTIMARPAFKAWWTRIVPSALERSTFVLAASLILLLLYWQWRPLPGVVWHLEQPVLRAAIWLLYGLGWGIVLYASFLIDHFDLFGLRQVYVYWSGQEYRPHPFMERSMYRYIRHPLMAGFLLAFWAAPTMTWGRLLFAVVTSAYIVIGIHIEERDLVRILGDPYAQYRQRTAMLLPLRRVRRP